MKIGKAQLTAIFLIVLQSLLYGLGDPISKTAFDTVPLFRMLSIRYCIALAVILAIWHKRIIAGIKASRVRDWIIPVLCMGGSYVTNNVALLMTQATAVAFIRSLPTIIAPLLAFLVYRRKYGKRLIGIQLLTVVGLYMLCCGKGGLELDSVSANSLHFWQLYCLRRRLFSERNLWTESIRLHSLHCRYSQAQLWL